MLKLKNFFLLILLICGSFYSLAQDSISVPEVLVDTCRVVTDTISDADTESVITEGELLRYENDSVSVPDLKISPAYKKEKDFSFRPNQLIVPLSLIAVGTVGCFSDGFHKLNNYVKEGIGKKGNTHYSEYDDWLQYVPAAGYLALGFYKNKRKLDFKERVLVEATAYLSMTALVNIAKYSFKEKRPDSGIRNSFPSGHTATAFTGAELIRAEFGWGIGSVAYAISTGVAFLRIYNNRHWLNDVIAGAGVGILSARIGYWMLPLYRKWFHWDKNNSKSYLVTSPGISVNNLSLNMLYTF